VVAMASATLFLLGVDSCVLKLGPSRMGALGWGNRLVQSPRVDRGPWSSPAASYTWATRCSLLALAGSAVTTGDGQS
jgi:hypothetical protein